MQRLVFTALMVLTMNASAQEATNINRVSPRPDSVKQYIQVGGHGGWGITQMANKNVAGSGEKLDQKLSFAATYGIHIMALFTNRLGLQLEANRATVTQSYRGNNSGSLSTWVDKVYYWDIPVLVQYKYGRWYVEAGPKFSLLTKATEDRTVGSGARDESLDIKRGFSNSFISAVLGVGGEFPLTTKQNIFLNAGIRLAYGLNDATLQYSSQSALYDDNPGIATIAANRNDKYEFSYQKTRVIAAQLMLGVSYRLPY